MFAAEIRRKRVDYMRGHTHWKWHLDEMYVKINGEMHYLWRAVDHEGEVLESFATKERDKPAALKFMKKLMKRHGTAEKVTTDGLRSYKAAMKELGNAHKQVVGLWANNPGGKQPPALTTKRAGDAPVPEDEDTPEIRLGSRLSPQPLQPGAPPHQPPNLQGETLRGPLEWRAVMDWARMGLGELRLQGDMSTLV
jgi:IS1 family transposase